MKLVVTKKKCEYGAYTVKDNIVLDSIEGIKGKNEVAKLYFKKKSLSRDCVIFYAILSDLVKFIENVSQNIDELKKIYNTI